MLLNSVAVGKAYETYHNKPTLVCPPKGCDSVRQLHSLRGEPVYSKRYTFLGLRESWPRLKV